MTPLATLAVAGCLAVNPGSDKILAGDLSDAIPGLTVPAREIAVALAPAPGVQRVFRAAELRRMALRFGWTWQPESDLCVERPVAAPDPSQYLAAMRKALPEAGITLLDYGRQRVPAGAIEFPASGLHSGPSGALWMGAVRYAGTHRFPVWARVQVLVPVTRVVAAVDLAPGRAIESAQVRAETRQECPSGEPVPVAEGDVVGKWPRAAIRAGTVLRAALLENPKVVLRGDTVTVDVFDGAAHLTLEAVAEGAGAVGENIPVENPDSHRRFTARVEAKGKVSVGSPAAKVTP